MIIDELRMYLANHFGYEYEKEFFIILEQLGLTIETFDKTGYDEREKVLFKLIDTNEKIRADPQLVLEIKEILQMTKISDEQIIEDSKERRKVAVDKYLSHLEKARYKLNLLINIFVLNSIEMEVRGYSHEDAIHTIRKSLKGILDQLKMEYFRLEKDFDMPAELRVGRQGLVPRHQSLDSKEYNDMFFELIELWIETGGTFNNLTEQVIKMQEECVEKAKQGTQFHNVIERKLKDIDIDWNELKHKYRLFVEKNDLKLY